MISLFEGFYIFLFFGLVNDNPSIGIHNNVLTYLFGIYLREINTIKMINQNLNN